MYWVLDEKTRLTGCQLVRDQVFRTIQEVGIETYKGFIREAVEEGRRTLIGCVKQLTFPGEYEAPAFITFLGPRTRPFIRSPRRIRSCMRRCA